MAGEKTVVKKTISRARRTKTTKGPTEGRRKYTEDVKCSVDVGAKTRARAEEGTVKTGPATAAKFQKGGGAANEKTSKSLTELPKDSRAKACTIWMENVLDMGLRGIRTEFMKVAKNYVPQGSHDACDEHLALNRYDDVLCLDKTRVKLKNNPEGDDYIHASYVTVNDDLTRVKLKNNPEGDDYIHASYVTVNDDLVYICAQGPLSNTAHHFWLMIMQENCKVVLQLCQLIEDGKEKCNEYYPTPTDGNDWKTYGSVQVKIVDRTSNVAGMKKVTKTKMQVRMEDKKDSVHELTHIFYQGWPDHSVAESVATCREVRALVHRLYEKKPIVAHCSAGIGRTGTFVMIELVAYRLLVKHDTDLRMLDVMKELREQRMHAIQNDQQYVFVFRCVLEILLHEDALPKTPEITKFIEDYENLIARKKAERAKNKAKGGQTV
uniref:Protein tyrosine phosphatase n=1 Tax=Panagrolaimus sp. JU765 TaxID=591449 RepID=A0AC34PYH5_9BILA